MNAKAKQWLRLAAFLRERIQKLKRFQGKLDFSADKLPKHIDDSEILEFMHQRLESCKELQACKRLETEATYQAVLSDPTAESEILALYEGNQERQDALYAFASEYTRRLEDEASREEMYRSSRQRKGGRIWQLLALGVLLVVGGVGLFAFLQYRSMGNFLERPIGEGKGTVTVEIPRGVRPNQAADLLTKAGVVREEERTQFKRLLRYHKYIQRAFSSQLRAGDARVRFGQYVMPTNLTPIQILARLRKGPPRKAIRVTIPEGFNIWKIAARLEAKGICKAKDFLRLARDRQYAQRLLGWSSPSLEGYLYPDTYQFDKKMAPARVIQVMVNRFKSLYTDDINRKAKAKNMTTHQVITLASIIEKETGHGFERPQISLVFHNRMRRGWKLETDPTVIYGLLPNFDGNIRSRDLHNPHPYNTYKHKGLPPGPIASPGIAAIRAALAPKGRSCIIFFVARNDKTHVFTCTKRDHECWVDVYQRKTKSASACRR